MNNLLGPILLGLAASAACSRSSPDGTELAASTPVTSNGAPSVALPRNATSSTPTSSRCPRTGLWAACSVETRLGQSGFVVRRVSEEAKRRPGFSVPPMVYTLGRTRLEVFIYPSESAVAADVAKLDTVSAAPRGARNPWLILPTFVRNGNLATVFLTENPTQAERFTLAITAGAPQP